MFSHKNDNHSFVNYQEPSNYKLISKQKQTYLFPIFVQIF